MYWQSFSSLLSGRIEGCQTRVYWRINKTYIEFAIARLVLLCCIDLNSLLSSGANGKNLGHFGIKYNKDNSSSFLPQPKHKELDVTIRQAFQAYYSVVGTTSS